MTCSTCKDSAVTDLFRASFMQLERHGLQGEVVTSYGIGILLDEETWKKVMEMSRAVSLTPQLFLRVMVMGEVRKQQEAEKEIDGKARVLSSPKSPKAPPRRTRRR
jgi:hypothetical protein